MESKTTAEEHDYLEEHYFDSTNGNEHSATEVDGVLQPQTSAQHSVLQLRAQYVEELKQVEEEIQTLKQVLTAKYRRQHFLKRQLGITVMSELREEVNKSMDTLRTSEAYQKTTAAVKTAKEKTTTALHEKWNILRQTNAFKSFEDKLGMAYSSVRGKIVRSATATGDRSPSGETSLTEPQDAKPTIESTWSKDGTVDIVKTGTGASPNRTPSINSNPSDNPTATNVVPAGKIQLEEFGLDDQESDETEEFVQAVQPNSHSKRKSKHKTKSFAD